MLIFYTHFPKVAHEIFHASRVFPPEHVALHHSLLSLDAHANTAYLSPLPRLVVTAAHGLHSGSSFIHIFAELFLAFVFVEFVLFELEESLLVVLLVDFDEAV